MLPLGSSPVVSAAIETTLQAGQGKAKALPDDKLGGSARQADG
jgi:hypothetical protein